VIVARGLQRACILAFRVKLMNLKSKQLEQLVFVEAGAHEGDARLPAWRTGSFNAIGY
jgi:hypothetical protein